jgi:hypothetical protein
VVDCGPCCSVIKLWVPLLATVLAVALGADYSGPSLNPGAAWQPQHCWTGAG